MNDLIERIKQSVKKHSYHIVHGINNHDEGMTVQGFYQVINEELVKEPREEPNIPIQCVDGSCPIALSEEYEERGMDVIHSCAECPYQPQVQPIVRTAEEIVEMLNRISCPECDRNSRHCHFSEKDCKNYWIDWLTKKEV